MRRRDFIGILGGAAAWPMSVGAQERNHIRRLGVIMNYAEIDPEGQARFSALREQLHKLGWVEGNNIQIDGRWAAGKDDLMQAYSTELVSLPADVLVVNSSLLLAVLMQLTRAIPIVFTQVADPIGSGFVSSYARPDGNVTGFTDFDISIAGKWIEVLKEAAPFLNRVTVLMDSTQTNHARFLRVMETVASSLGMQVSAAAVRDRPEVEKAMTALAGEVNRGLVVLPGPINNGLRHSIIDLAGKYRLPAIYPLKYYVSDGGLLYYGIDQVEQWSKAAGYVDRILRGGKLSALPVQAPIKFELIINMKTAKALGLSISPMLIARADEVID